VEVQGLVQQLYCFFAIALPSVLDNGLEESEVGCLDNRIRDFVEEFKLLLGIIV